MILLSAHTRYFLAILLLSTCILFFRLGSTFLYSWDEAIYAECAKEMVQTGDWLTLHWNGEKFFQKPPLLVWSEAILYTLFGISEFTSRAVSAFFGVAVVLLTFLLARRIFSARVAFVSAFILLIYPVFFHFSRAGMTDTMLTFFMLLAIYAYLYLKNMLVVGLACGLALMTKGPAVLPLLLTLGYIVIRERKLEIWKAGMVFIVVGGAWHILMIYMYGWAFTDQFFGYQTLRRVVQPTDDNGPHMILNYVIGLGLFLPFLPFGIKRLWKKRDVPLLLPVFGLSVVLLYSLAQTKHIWYLLPALPIISILIAPGPGMPRAWVYYVMIIACIGANIGNHEIFKTERSLHQSLAALSRRASNDTGTLGVYPGIDFGPEVLFYANRRLCAEGTHSMTSLTRCSPDHLIIWQRDFGEFSHRCVPVETLGEFVYCASSSQSRH